MSEAAYPTGGDLSLDRPGQLEYQRVVPQDDIDQLVEAIASRVQQRLAGGGVQGARALPVVIDRAMDGVACTADVPSQADCDACQGGCASRREGATRAIAAAGADRIGAGGGLGQPATGLAHYIDHTLLKPEATRDDVRKLCEDARRYSFASVCVNTTWVPLARSMLAGSAAKVCAVVGFPLGAMVATAKAFEAREAVRAGAEEIDMVINIGALKSRDYATVLDDIRKVVEAARPAHVKVILETGALTLEEKIVGITLAKIAGAHFVKTSTGFGPGGATVEDIALMRKLVGNEMGVKASGGVRTQDDAQKMIAAGATRIGASASVAIVTGATDKKAAAGKY
jgi:deoxyribose-phosphate aldolase